MGEDVKRKCFIITPIGNDGSETFRKAKGVIESVIKPTLFDYGFDDIKPAYEINVSGMINTQIINRIVDDDLVIANLTGNNPNVMYELCLRHVVAKPIIHICEKGTVLPFDIKDNRTIFYTDDMLGAEELKGKIRLFLKEMSYDKDQIDNPIYNAIKYGKLLKDTQGTDDNKILQLLMDISNQLSEDRNYKGYVNSLVLEAQNQNVEVQNQNHEEKLQKLERYLGYVNSSLENNKKDKDSE